MNKQSNIKKVIGVVSGKGGVGKSSVTALLAVACQRRGLQTAILDADITGPSIPTALGLTEKAAGSDQGIFPVVSRTGIRTMSINSLLEDRSDPVVWRGPILSGAVQQFWNDVLWGDVDVMYVDMPPGTGDVALTVFQSMPLDGLVIVTSPQELVFTIVEKAVKMAEMMQVPIIGVVENMAYFRCPDCGARHDIFGPSHVTEIREKYAVPVAVDLPMDPKLAAACDDGTVEAYSLGEEGAPEGPLTPLIDACLAADNPVKRDGFDAPPDGCTGSCETCGVEDCGSRQ